jgi:NAD/NADP transhydrogenase alpha subunit
MNKNFIQVTNGLLPVGLLALLAVAFVAGQARANLPNQVTSTAHPVLSSTASIILSADVLRSAESLPQVVDTLMTLPAEIQMNTLLLSKGSSVDGPTKRRTQTQ